MLTIILLSGISIACCCVNVRLYKIISELEDRLAIQNKYRWTNSSNPVFQNDSTSDFSQNQASDLRNQASDFANQIPNSQIPKTNSAADMKPSTWGEFSSFHIPPSFAQKNNQTNSMSNTMYSTWDNIKTQTASLTGSTIQSVSNRIKNVVRQFEPQSESVIESGLSNTISNGTHLNNILFNNSSPNNIPHNCANTSMYVPPNLTLDDANFVSSNTEESFITASNTFNNYNMFSNIENPPFVVDSHSILQNNSEFSQDSYSTTQPTLYDPLINNMLNNQPN